MKNHSEVSFFIRFQNFKTALLKMSKGGNEDAENSEKSNRPDDAHKHPLNQNRIRRNQTGMKHEGRIQVRVQADRSYEIKGIFEEIEHRHKYEMMSRSKTLKNVGDGPKLRAFGSFRPRKELA